MFERVAWYHLFAGIVLLTAVAVALSPGSEDITSQIDPGTGTLAFVSLEGPISYGTNVQQSGISPEQVSRLTEQAVDEGADAVVYKINSGGGAVVASRQAARTVDQASVPTVCWITEVGASGAYWIASACDEVVADPLSLTGSIGVRTGYLEFSGLLDKLGIDYVNLTSAEFKDMGSQYKNLSDAERRRFEEILNTTHDYFVRSIADNRNMSVFEAEQVATGEVFTGLAAEEQGLVDRLGGRDEAVDAARDLTGKESFRTRSYDPAPGLGILRLLATKIGEGIAAGLQGESREGLQARAR